MFFLKTFLTVIHDRDNMGKCEPSALGMLMKCTGDDQRSTFWLNVEVIPDSVELLNTSQLSSI